MQRLPHARVLAEEGLAMVLDPVHHLAQEKKEKEKKKPTITVTVAEELHLPEEMHSDSQPSELLN